MKLSTKHQELLDGLHPEGYDVKKLTKKNGNVVDESEYFHILFVKIISQPGQHENKLIPMVQKMAVQDWGISLQLIKKFNIGGVTQQDEFSIIHDPTVKVTVPKEEKAKPGPKPTNK